jgi:DnaJ-class molecular chaperone
MTKCTMCDGSGLVSTGADINCPACLGTGKVFGQICSGCGGSGSETIAIEVLCPVCKGRGDGQLSKTNPSGPEQRDAK